MLFLIVITCFAFAFGAEEYNFQCKPKPGCDFSECDQIPSYIRSMEGFDVEEYRKRNVYHITCQPKFDIDLDAKIEKKVEKHNKDHEDEIGNMEARIEEKMAKQDKEHEAEIETMDAKFEEKMAKQKKEQEDEIKKLQASLKKNLDDQRKERASVDRKFTQLNARVDDLVKQITRLNNERASVDRKFTQLNARVDELVKQTTRSIGDNCKTFPDGFQYGDKCFWLTIKYSYSGILTYDVGKSFCKDRNGNVGSVYSGDHYKMIEEAARKKIEGRSVSFWTAMTYDLSSKKVYLGNSIQAPYVKWYSSLFPAKYPGHTGIKILVDAYNHGFYNVGRADSDGVLCERAI